LKCITRNNILILFQLYIWKFYGSVVVDYDGNCLNCRMKCWNYIFGRTEINAGVQVNNVILSHMP
jgi:hypothetical protein